MGGVLETCVWVECEGHVCVGGVCGTCVCGWSVRDMCVCVGGV